MRFLRGLGSVGSRLALVKEFAVIGFGRAKGFCGFKGDGLGIEELLGCVGWDTRAVMVDKPSLNRLSRSDSSTRLSIYDEQKAHASRYDSHQDSE